jgi:hypothetical protein
MKPTSNIPNTQRIPAVKTKVKIAIAVTFLGLFLAKQTTKKQSLSQYKNMMRAGPKKCLGLFPHSARNPLSYVDPSFSRELLHESFWGK